jgi:dolichol-phosphate mannosyltransferase
MRINYSKSYLLNLIVAKISMRLALSSNHWTCRLLSALVISDAHTYLFGFDQKASWIVFASLAAPPTTMNSERTLIIIPTYNERENVPTLVQKILSVVPRADVLLVDDGSPDGTADYAEEVFAGEPRFSVMRRKGRRGLGRSYADGYRYALDNRYARLVQMDADFSHDPNSLPDLIRPSSNYHVVIGSRYCDGGRVRNWPLHRRLLSRFANRYVSVITGLKVNDATSGFRCYARKALEKLVANSIRAEGYAFLVESTYQAHKGELSIAEVPITFVDRREGKSKISRKVILESIITPWRLRFSNHTKRSD